MLSADLAIFLASIFLAVIVSSATLPIVELARGQQTDPYTFAENTSPYGIPFKIWVEKWQQWYVNVTKDVIDKWNTPNIVSVDCLYHQKQGTSTVFVPYVAAEKGSTATMTCHIPQGKALLISIDGGVNDYRDPTVQPKTPQEILNLVTKSNVYPNSFDATLNGHPLHLTNDEIYKVTTDLFNLTLPSNNLWSPQEAPGPGDTAIVQGWWLFLKPLPVGDNILHYITGYRDSKSDPTIPPGQGNTSPYIQDVTIHFIVSPPV